MIGLPVDDLGDVVKIQPLYYAVKGSLGLPRDGPHHLVEAVLAFVLCRHEPIIARNASQASRHCF